MTYKRLLMNVEIAALVSLLVASTVLAGIATAQTATATHSLSITNAAKLIFVYTLLIGALPVILFGAPTYAALSYFGKIGWFNLIAIGIAPGLALMFFEKEFGIWAASVGLIVAVLTHLVCRKRLICV